MGHSMHIYSKVRMASQLLRDISIVVVQLCKANPSCCLVSGPGHIQIRMRVGRFGHYVIITHEYFLVKNVSYTTEYIPFTTY